MRLIDADKLRWSIRNNAPKCVPLWVYETIDEAPTAYSVEKVVTELEEIKDKYFCTVNEYQRGARDGAKWVKKNAIDIVRNGGKE